MLHFYVYQIPFFKKLGYPVNSLKCDFFLLNKDGSLNILILA